MKVIRLFVRSQPEPIMINGVMENKIITVGKIALWFIRDYKYSETVVPVTEVLRMEESWEI